MGPSPSSAGPLGEYLCALMEGRRQFLNSARHLRAHTELEPQHLQALLSGLERLEAIPILSTDSEPWVSLLIETQIATLLTKMPVELNFREKGKAHGESGLKRLRSLSSGHPIFGLGVAQIIQSNLQANSL